MKRTITSCLILVVFLAASVTAVPIVELTPFSGYTGINVSAINDSGAAVGYCTKTTGAVESFIWTQAGGMQSLGTGYYARGINNNGQIVGDNGTGASIYWGSSTATAQTITAAFSNGGIAYGINDDGLVVGRSGYQGTPAVRKAYVWDSATGSITFVDGVTEFYAVNGSGVASGMQRSIYDYGTAVLTTVTNAGHTDTWGSIRAINNGGDAAGIMSGGTNPTNAFLRASDGTITQLGTLVGYSASTMTPMGINELGQVVGDAGYGGAAFIWENGILTDLDSFVTASGWDLKYANDINANGWIVGTGMHNGSSVGFVLVPEPATMVLLGLGGLLCRKFRKA